MLTDLAKDKTVEEAKRITDDDVVEALGGIPERKKHCSLLGVLALQAAIKDWEMKCNLRAISLYFVAKNRCLANSKNLWEIKRM